MDNNNEWTIIESKKTKKIRKMKEGQHPRERRHAVRSPTITASQQRVGTTFQANRPGDTNDLFKNDQLSDEEDEENEENIILESPLIWHKFALIGDVNIPIQMVLMRYNIFPSSESGKLQEIGCRVLRENWHWRDEFDCEIALENFSKRCSRQFIFISIIPEFTPRKYGSGKEIYFVHVRFDNYFLAEERPRIIYTIDMPEYYGLLGDKPTHDPISLESDDVEDNKSNFMRIMKIVEGKMKHDKFQESFAEEPIKSLKKPYYSPLPEGDFVKFKNSIYKCKLYLEDSFSGFGVILDERHLERKVYLHNRRNCYQAFNEDIVNIMVFQESYVQKNNKGRQTKEKEIWSGRVVSVEHSDVKPVNKIFLCKLAFGHANHMIPICKTIPVIAVDNSFAKEKVKLYYGDLINGLAGMVVGIENLNQRRIKPEKCNTFADKSFVTLKTLHDNLATTVNRMQYVDCFRCEFIFLVLYRHWQSDFGFPFGEVVGLYTPDASFAKTLPLIAVSCDLSVISIEEEGELKSAVKKIKVDTIKSRQNTNDNRTKINKKVFGFRYKNQPYTEVAYSYEDYDEDYFKMGIHVCNVEKYIKQGDYLDKYAMKQFFTFLLPFTQGIRDETKPSYLFSEALTNGILSINREYDVSVISFYFVVGKNTLTCERFANISIEQIKLDEEFDAEIVDEMIEGESTPYIYLKYVHRTCLFNRLLRIGSHNIPPSWFYPDFTFKMDLSTFIISNEMEILANRFVSELLSENSVDDFPVNVEESISHESKFQSWMTMVKENCFVKIFPTLSLLFKTNRTESRIKTIRLSDQVLDETIDNASFNLFKCDMLFPDVSFYYYKLDNIVSWNTVMPRSDAADSPFTVSITKPLSCFNDLLLQRLLISRQNNYAWNYSDDDISDICELYTDNKSIFTKYWKICRGYEIKDRFENTSFSLDCVYEDVTEEAILFNHPFLRDVNHENFILFECIGLNKVKQSSTEDTEYVVLDWQTRIFICENNSDCQILDKITQLSDIYLYKTNVWRRDLNSTDLTDLDLTKLKYIQSENKYPINLTSESSRYMDPKITLSLALEKRQILRIQFNYSYNLGVMKIIPELLIVNPHLRVCLGHRHDPFKYFILPKYLSKINYQRFQNIDAYKEQFRILSRIEGIHQTISERTSYFIHDVNICWIGIKNYESIDDVFGVVLLDQDWCRERLIKLGHQNLKIQDPVYTLRKAVKNNKMEFIVCIQSFLDARKVYWLGHAHIADVAYVGNLKDKKLHLTLKLVHSNFPLKPKFKQLYSLEIMETPITARVLDRNLRKLDEDSLIANIVMKKITNMPREARVHIDYDEEIKQFMTKPYQLNQVQFRALNTAINQEFSLIWGPPGTGKTMVGCIIAFAFTQINKRQSSKSNSTVLYCGPSNQSVDVVAEKLMKIFGEKCPKLLRIYSSDVMNADFPYPAAIINNELSTTSELLKPIALHHIIRQKGKPYADIFRNFEIYFQEHVLRDKESRAMYSKRLIKYHNKLKLAFKTEVDSGNYEIVLCTTVGSCKKLIDSFSITQVIIDESGMCSEPEAIGPLINRKDLKNIIFIGDHKQLRPIITSPAAKGKQLNLSLFERIYDPAKSYCTMLEMQYRMHPSICEFPSTHFYGHGQSKLITALSESWTGIPSSFVIDRTRYNGLQYVGLRRGYEAELAKNNVNIADHIFKAIRKVDFKCYPFHLDFSLSPVKEKILFINVEGYEVNQAVSGAAGHVKSKGNDLEVKAVGMLYKSLLEKMKKKNTASESILIITQYRLQEHLLKKALNEILEKLKIPGPPRVSTVVKSQGSECDYVIFSTVRSLPHKKDIDMNPSPGWISKYLGFITDQNQFNVAITRAKKGLFIIGNSNLLSVNQDWRSLIQDLKQRDCFADTIFDAIN